MSEDRQVGQNGESDLRKKAAEPLHVSGAPSRPEDLQQLVHEREVHQAELAAQNEELLDGRQRAILEAIPDPAWLKDRAGRFLAVNAAWCKFTGRSARECLGKTHYHLFPYETAKRLEKDDLRTIREGHPLRLEESLADSEGLTTWFETSKSPLFDDQGAVIGTVGIAHDITNRKRAEEQLHALSARDEAILAAVPEIVAQTNVNKVYTWMNDAGLEFFGPDAPGKEVSAYFVGRQDTYEKVQPLFAGSVEVVRVESLQRRKDGQQRLLSWRCRTLKDGSGNVVGSLSTARDITDRKRAEDRLADYQRRLRSLGAKLALAEEQERRRIAADLHDDVGQTLSVALMKLQSLRKKSPPAAAAPLEEIGNLLGHAVRSTRSLLFDLSPPPLYELGLEAAIEWLAEKTQEEHKLPVAFDRDDNAAPLTDEIRGILFRAVREALHNTVKYADAKNVRITSRQEDALIRIEVADDGKGFDPAKPLRDASGGFGLFHIRERLDHAGGRLEIQSEPGRGTRIVLLAPLAKNTPGGKGGAP